MCFCCQGDAAKAVLQADGLQMGEHQINVAISNPPRRRTPLEQRSAVTSGADTATSARGGGASNAVTSSSVSTTTTFTPTLGSGKRSDVSSRSEKPRTLLAFKPRAVAKPRAKQNAAAFIASAAAAAGGNKMDATAAADNGDSGSERALDQSESAAIASKNDEQNSAGLSSAQNSAGLSNNQFRDMLLGKKAA